MKTLRILIPALAALSSFLLPPSSFAQGSLTPPGAPAPTMKRLDEVEPRTNLQATPAPAGVDTTDANYHFVINLPGSYYLSSNLDVTKPNGIRINAEGVSLDLNGFQVARSSGSSGDGIHIEGAGHNATIRGGSVKGFSKGISSLARSSAFRDLSVSDCTSYGIDASTADGAIFESCRVHSCSGEAALSAGDGAVFSNCTVVYNTVNGGIQTGSGATLTNCTVAKNTCLYAILTNQAATLTNCSAFGNITTYGFFVGDNSALSGCSASNNTSSTANSAGFKTGLNCTLTHCTASNNFSSAATSTSNSGMGFDLAAGSAIEHCVANWNKGDGIKLTSDGRVRANTCDSNGNAGDGAGIHITGFDNRVDDNNVTDNDRGIHVALAGNLIVKNSATGNGINYEIAAGNAFGAIVDTVGPGGSPTGGPVSGSSAASSVLTTDPWANISY